MVDRIKQVLEYTQMSSTAFADAIDVNRSSMTHIFSGRNQPSLDIAKKILLAFPEISTEWLIMGVGSMIQNKVSETIAPMKNREAVQETPISVSTVDNMQQTDLFLALEMDQTPTTSMVDKQDTTIPNLSREVSPIANTPIQSKQNEDTVSSTVPHRAKSRYSDSHFPSRESKKDKNFNSQGDKKIVKIVFFYEDKSFDIYMPNS